MPVPYSVRKERFNRQAQAFYSTFGNPYGYPEPVQGHYQVLRGRSTLRGLNVEIAAISVNPCKPSTTDFLIDCDLVLEECILKFVGKNPKQFKETLAQFIDTYITETGQNELDKKDRIKLEQEIGKLLIRRKIAPIAQYFTVLRKRGN